MNKIKKLGIAVIALAMCLLLGVTVWAVEGEVSFEAEADKSSFCVTGADQTVTVTISAGKEIDIFSLQADLVIPEGWSATVSSTSLTGTLESSKGHILWYDETSENVKATDLIVLTVTIPAAVEPATYEIGLQYLEATKIDLENDGSIEYLANGATITTEIEVKAHDWGAPTYTKDGETHTATYVCGNDANHTKTEGPTDHIYDQEDGTKCVCGAEKPAAPAGLKGDIDLDNDVDMDDLTYFAEHIAKIITITDPQSLANAEVTGDNELTMDDLTKLAEFVAKIIPDLD